MALTAGHQHSGTHKSPSFSRYNQGNNSDPFVHVFSDFPEMLMSKLNAQRRDSSLCDVTIVTNDGRSYRAHKAVLAACSHYLEGELAALGEERPDGKSEAVIHLGMISSQSFETLLDLLYTSKLILTNDNVAQVLSAAEALDLEQVSTICRQFLRSHITSKTVTRATKRHDSLDVFQDENNNNITSDSPEDDLQRPECYKRGQSEESMASSSGVSSLSTEISEKESQEHATMLSEAKFSEGTMEHIPERPVSLSDMPPPTQAVLNTERPSSAPHLRRILKEEEKREYSPPSPNEFVDVTSTDWAPETPKSPRDTLSNEDSSFGDVPKNIPALYRVKREIQNTPVYYSRPEYPENGIAKDHSRNAESLGKNNFNQNDAFGGQNLRNFQRSHSLAGPNGPIAFHHLPLSHRRSYDSVFNDQSGFANHNSLPSPSRKKAKSIDQSSGGLPYANMVPGVFQGQGSHLQSSQSFWASLYMLRSQALTSAGFLGTSAKDTQHIPPYSTAPNFPGRQLQHSKSVVASRGLVCKLCRLEFTSEWSLSMHSQLCHPVNYLYQPQETQTLSHLHSYSRETSEKNAAIDLATHPPTMSKSTSPFERRESFHDRSKNNIQKEFSEKMLDLVNNNDTKTVHRCYHCKKEFESIFLLRKHKSVEHMKRPFRCHRCDSAFPNKAGLSVHLRSHTGERPYRCKICNKAFTQLGHVQRHQKVHTGEKPYQCPLCQARVRDKASMHYHILAHRGVKPFQCDQCDARFTKRSSLVKHKNVHTGSFLYQCPQCKASFREKASLSRHVRSQHKDPCFTVNSDHVSANSENNQHQI